MGDGQLRRRDYAHLEIGGKVVRDFFYSAPALKYQSHISKTSSTIQA